MRILKSLLCLTLPLALTAFPVLPVSGQQCTIYVTITNIQSHSGLLRFALYDAPEQFPNDPKWSFSYKKDTLKNARMEVVLKDYSPGTYAICLLDDEDGDNQMDYKFMHLPEEGYGFSNNVKPGLKCPPFKKCVFKVFEDGLHLEIEMQYFRKKT